MKKVEGLAVRRGRPSLSQAEQIEEHILTIATKLFLMHGYGITSIESIAQAAGISKRTFYHRFENKSALFAAVVHRLIMRLRPKHEAAIFAGQSLKDILRQVGKAVLHASLSEEALGLHRMLMSEAGRFPELARILDREGSRREAINRIAALLKQETGKKQIVTVEPHFAAEQFLEMMMAVPQRRALGIGMPMTPGELDAWVTQTVELLLHGISAS